MQEEVLWYGSDFNSQLSPRTEVAMESPLGNIAGNDHIGLTKSNSSFSFGQVYSFQLQ